MIKVFPWNEAPDDLKALSGHGGDEDWVIIQTNPPNEPESWSWPGSQVAEALNQGYELFGTRSVWRGDPVMIWIIAHA